MRNKIAALTVLSVLSLVLTACTLQDLPVIGQFFGSPAVDSSTATLNVWGLWEDPEVMQMMIDKYKETHPNVTINYEDRSVLKPSDYKERVYSRITQDIGADIVRVHSSWVLTLKDALSPMPAKLMDANAYSQAFYPIAAESAISEGKIYGMPLYYDGLVLVYNKDHFEQVGEVGPPTAWEEFRRIARRLVITAGEESNFLVRGGAAIGSAVNIDHFSDILGLMFAQADVSVPDGLDSQAAQDALSFYTNFIKIDKVWDLSLPEASSAFSQQKVSMILVPSWHVLDILAANPELNVGVAPVPQARADRPVTWSNFWMDVVPVSSSNPAAAWEFLNFLAQEEQQLMKFSETSKNKPFGAPFSRVNMAAQLENSEYLQPVISTARYGKSNLLAGRAGNKKEADALAEAVQAVLDGTSPQEALRVAKEKMTR